MRRAWFVLALLLLAVPAAAQGISSPTKVEVRDEGASQGRVGAINCTGSGVTCSVSGDVATFNAAGGSGSANVVEVSIDLGASGGLAFSVTVTGQAWVTTSSVIACSPFATDADGQTVETIVAAGFSVNAATRVAGTGFDLWVFSPHGATGTFRFHCTGA